MNITPQADDRAVEDGGATLTLSAAQIKALGLKHLPVAGAQVQIRATATVRSLLPDAGRDDADPADPDADGDGDGDGNASRDDGDAAQDAKAGGDAPGSLTLLITGLALTQARKAPDKVLYGGGD